MADERVLIVGGGTFGLSTALELLRKGHKDVVIVDKYPTPSPISAGNDVNKILQSTVDSEFYSSLALESLQMWRKDPVYREAFHETGIVYAATGREKVEDIKLRYKFLTESGHDVEKLTAPEDFSRYARRLDENKVDERFANWYGYFQQSNCGWVYARGALESAAAECQRLGAMFVTDSVTQLIFDHNDECIGVETERGKTYHAGKTVICAGANSYRFLDFKDQLLAKCFALGHVKVSDKEADILKGSPVVLNLDEGFVFEADENNEVKFCNEFPGLINMVDGQSVPVYKDAIPASCETQMRGFLRQIYPSLASRPFTLKRICWCTDTPDRHFLIGSHPGHRNLVLGTGDSGQGFKYMPNIGRYIADVVLQGDHALPEDKRSAWAWRPQTGKSRDIKDLQNRYGGSNVIQDLKDISSWSNNMDDLSQSLGELKV